MFISLQASDDTYEYLLCDSIFKSHYCKDISECPQEIENLTRVFCSSGCVVSNCIDGSTGECCYIANSSTSIVADCKSTSQSLNQIMTMMTCSTRPSQSITSFSLESTAIQTATQSTQDTTHINNLTIITISVGGILLLIVLTLAVICVILSVVIIAKRHCQFQPGKCHINNNNN